jgi:inositol 1,4,5-triphosphate receptor type 1
LLDIVYREETLLNVIRSVTKNGRSILLTAVLAVILIYLFSIVGFIFFKDDFVLEVDALDTIGINRGANHSLRSLKYALSFVCVDVVAAAATTLSGAGTLEAAAAAAATAAADQGSCSNEKGCNATESTATIPDEGLRCLKCCWLTVAGFYVLRNSFKFGGS